MILNIENLGVIKQAHIDLSKKFILFCGRNNTGKTYASYVLHSFLTDGGIYFLPCFKSIVGQLKLNGSFTIEKSFIEEWLFENCNMVKSQMGSIFGISDTTCAKLFQKFALSVNFSDEDFQNTLAISFNATIKDGNSFGKISKLSDSNIVSIDSNTVNELFSNSESMRAASLLCSILRKLAFGKMAGVRMLTVERNSIYTFKTELSLSRNELIDHIQQSDNSEFDIIEILNKSSRRYPQAVRSSLRIANDLENVQKYDSEFASIADMIEKELLKGEVNMTKNGDVEFHADNMAKSRRLPFHLSSSIVKTMASLVIYLRHIAKNGDTLIIDEPEMNFHPDVQVLLARIFAILTTKGLHIVVSTHSDYIIRELNNLIMASAIYGRGNDSFLNDFGYQRDMLLDYQDLLVMFFEKTSKSAVTVKQLPISQEGFSVSTIDSTIISQNNVAERLYGTLINYCN